MSGASTGLSVAKHASPRRIPYIPSGTKLSTAGEPGGPVLPLTRPPDYSMLPNLGRAALFQGASLG